MNLKWFNCEFHCYLAIFPKQTYYFGTMAQKEERKRKRQSNGIDSPSKRVAIDPVEAGEKIKVTFSENSQLHPALASTPGLTAPTVSFDAFARPLQSKSTNSVPRPSSHDLLLHSSKHPRLDYTASSIALNKDVSHYVAVYDPSAKQLQVTAAHHLSLRSAVRSEQNAEAKQRRTLAQQREELGREFGTKKAKKAIADKTVNAIMKDVKGKGKADGVQEAILESMADATADAPQKQEIEDALLASKPIPRPKLSAENVEDVYPFSTLVPQGDVRSLQIKDWIEKTKAGENMTGFTHRFPAFRVDALGKREDVQRLKALKYLELLLQFHDVLSGGGRSGRKVPKKEVMQKRLAEWPEALVDSVRRRFATSSNELPKWNMDNLYTHMCALSLFVDGWTSDIQALREDLRMENKEITQYYKELGCKVNSLTDKEREQRGLTKGQSAQTRIARLRLPLDFPKPRAGRRA